MKRLKRGAARSTATRAPKRTSFQAQKILVPLDFSEPSRSALRYAASLARRFGGRLTLLYALEPVATPDFAYHPLMMQPREAKGQAEQQLRKICESEGIDDAILAGTEVRSGIAHAVITDAAKEMDVDLIVIATHGNSGLKRVLLGSTAERVVRHAHCPVLAVRV